MLFYGISFVISISSFNRSRFAAIGAPLIAICCLGAAAFIIATTIVLSLIPLYIPAKTATAAGKRWIISSHNLHIKLISFRIGTRDYLLAMDLAAPIGADGTLDTSARQSLGPQVNISLLKVNYLKHCCKISKLVHFQTGQSLYKWLDNSAFFSYVLVISFK